MDATNCNFMVQAKLFWPWPLKTSPTKSSHRFHLRQVAETCWDLPCISLRPWLMQSGWAVALAVTACKNAFKPSSSWKPCPSDDLRYLAPMHQIAWSIRSRSWNMKLWYVKRQQWQIAHITPHESIRTREIASYQPSASIGASHLCPKCWQDSNSFRSHVQSSVNSDSVMSKDCRIFLVWYLPLGLELKIWTKTEMKWICAFGELTGSNKRILGFGVMHHEVWWISGGERESQSKTYHRPYRWGMGAYSQKKWYSGIRPMWHKCGAKGNLHRDVSWCIAMHTTVEPTIQRALWIIYIYMMLIDLQRDAKGTH